MSVVLKLFKLQIDELYNVFKGGNVKKMLGSLLKYALIAGGLTVLLQVLGMRIFILGFNSNVQLLSIALLATQIISLIFGVGSIISHLFFSKNNEILLTLPATHNQVFLSKMLVIYIQEAIVNSLYTLPLLAVVGIYAGFSWGYFLLMPLFLLLLPLFPLGIGAFLAIPVAQSLKFLKKHSALAIACILVAVAVGLVFYVQFLQSFNNFNVTSKQYETVRGANAAILEFGNKNWLYLGLARSMSNAASIGYLFIYMAIGLGCAAGAMLLVRPLFFKTAMQSDENAVVAVRAGNFKEQSAFISLIKKEFFTVFRSPGYVFQYFIFALLMPVIVLLYDSLLLSLDEITQAGKMMINGAHVLIVALLAMLSNIISASAISREGSNFYIVKSSPVNYYAQAAAKVTFNAAITVGAVVLTAIIQLIYGAISGASVSVSAVICSAVAVIFASCAHLFISFDMDLKNPTLDWYDSGDITKVNKNTTKSMLLALGMSAFMGLLVVLLASSSAVLAWAVLIAASLGLCAYKLYTLILRVSYRYEELEM